MLLEELQINGRASYRELGEKVGLTAPAVAERIRRFEEAGIIRAFRADVAWEAIGLPITAMVRATPKRDLARGELERTVAELPQVREAHRVTGSEHMWIKLTADSLGHLDEVLREIWTVADTTTNIVLASVVDHRPVTADAFGGVENGRASTLVQLGPTGTTT
jgi:Lrp/AsnC family leucine-responsive transcriptional regulator